MKHTIIMRALIIVAALAIAGALTSCEQEFFEPNTSAMPGGGTLSIRARVLDNGIEMRFEDSGLGIPEEQRNNIFEPFFSTKDGGTGLGLTVSYNIVTSHGGTLDIVDGRGTGACFRLFLPMGES